MVEIMKADVRDFQGRGHERIDYGGARITGTRRRPPRSSSCAAVALLEVREAQEVCSGCGAFLGLTWFNKSA